MPAYVLAHIDVTDPEHYKDYVRMVPSSIAQYGGRFLVRGPEPEILEGTWVPKRLVLIEFQLSSRRAAGGRRRSTRRRKRSATPRPPAP